MIAVFSAFLLGRVGAPGSFAGILSLAVAAVLLDLGVTANVVIGQRAIYALPAALRSRLNGLYMAIFFAGGALGSAVGGWAYARGGWGMATIAAVIPVAVALAAFMTEFKETSR